MAGSWSIAMYISVLRTSPSTVSPSTVWGVVSVKIVCARYRVYVFEKEGVYMCLRKRGYVCV